MYVLLTDKYTVYIHSISTNYINNGTVGKNPDHR